jgi:hypothetical protein
MANDLLTRLIIALDLLYDSTKDQIGIWSVLSDIIVEMQRSSHGRQTSRVKLRGSNFGDLEILEDAYQELIESRLYDEAISSQPKHKGQTRLRF